MEIDLHKLTGLTMPTYLSYKKEPWDLMHRTKPAEVIGWYREATEEEEKERRAAFRDALKHDHHWQFLTDDDIDRAALFKENGGYVLEDKEGTTWFIKGHGPSVLEREYRKIRAMIPFEYLNKKSRDFNWSIYGEDAADSKKLANNFIMRFQDFQEKAFGLYIYSSAKGSGKTMLACCLINEIAARYAVSVKFSTALDLLDLTKESYKGGDPDKVNELYHASLLVIDDIGVQVSREWVNETFYRLINFRYSNRLLTIYTSNLKPQELKMDERIVDRIEGSTIMLQLPAVSIRTRNKEEKAQAFLDSLEDKKEGSGT